MTMAVKERRPEHISPDVWRRAGAHQPVSPRSGKSARGKEPHCSVCISPLDQWSLVVLFFLSASVEQRDITGEDKQCD